MPPRVVSTVRLEWKSAGSEEAREVEIASIEIVVGEELKFEMRGGDAIEARKGRD